MKYTLFLSCINGFEDNCIFDIKKLGIKEITNHDGGVEFHGNITDIYKINQASRYGMHLYWEIAKFQFNEKKLYKDIYNINWDKYFNNIHSFSVKVKTANRGLNSQYTALVIKDGIVDYFSKKYRKRPNVDKHNPDIPIYIYINNDEIKIYIDTSGEPLYKRGYRTETIHAAPLNEVLASNLVANINYKNKQLYDPMCGSGTILIEAAMKELNIPAQICRKKFSFMNWFNYDSDLYKKIELELKNQIKSDKLSIHGSDNDEMCLKMIRGSIQKLGIEENFTLHNRNFFDFIPKEDSIVIFNPPYDIRIGVDKKLNEYYEKIGIVLKKHCKNSTIYIFTIDNEHLELIDIPCLKSEKIRNANLNCVLNTYQT